MSGAVIGVDVGGTNTDAVVLQGTNILGWSKCLTSPDLTYGVVQAVTQAISNAIDNGYDGKIIQMNIGTTHFLNAVIQRKNLSKVGIIRLCGPSTRALPPFTTFPPDLRQAIESKVFYVNGGYEYDGTPITQLDLVEIDHCIKELQSAKIKNIVISGVFSVVRNDQEKTVRNHIMKKWPEASVTVSHEIGSMQLVYRENACILNECLKELCAKTINGFFEAFQQFNIVCPIYFTQNDATILSADQVRKYPIFTFSSGPTNSMRGAVFLSGIKNGIVLDIGGTSSDIGLIQNGFPREATSEVHIGGVPTNFRMPDVLCEALGGGSIVDVDNLKVGPLSVANDICKMSTIFGGSTLTLSDIGVAAGLIKDFGQAERVAYLDQDIVNKCLQVVHSKIDNLVDRVKISAEDLDLIVVGGGSVIVDPKTKIKGISSIVHPAHFQVANAVGAACSQISGTVDEVICVDAHQSWEELLAQAADKAQQIAVSNGAQPQTTEVVMQSIVPLLYLPGNVVHVKVKAIGDLDGSSTDDVPSFKVCDAKQTPVCGQRDLNNELPTHKVIEAKVTAKTEAEMLAEFTPSEPYINSDTGEWHLSKYDVQCIAYGAAILGCGGGGSPFLGSLLLLQMIDAGKVPTIIHPKRLINNGQGDRKVASVAFYGSPMVLSEKISSGDECSNAIKCLSDVCDNRHFNDGRLQISDGVEIKEANGVVSVDDYQMLVDVKDDCQTYKEKFACICSFEVGGVNGIAPLIFGAQNGIAVVDADFIGRAVPEFQMTAPFILNPSLACPSVMTDEKGNMRVVLQSDSVKQLEDYFRYQAIQMGCSAAVANSALTVNQINDMCILGSLTRCWQIGNTLFKSKQDKQNPIDNIVKQENANLLWRGKITSVTRKTDGGFTRGIVVISDYHDETLKIYIEFQNEFLQAYHLKDGVKTNVATVPDLISIVDDDTCMPITSDSLEYGQRIAVLLLPPPQVLQSPKFIDVVGPKAFGIDVDYTAPALNFHHQPSYIPPS